MLLLRLDGRGRDWSGWLPLCHCWGTWVLCGGSLGSVVFGLVMACVCQLVLVLNDVRDES